MRDDDRGHEMGIRCAIYARVSDTSQVKGDSIEHQIMYARTFARRRGDELEQPWLTPDELVYIDAGISGTNFLKRKAVQALVRDARRGRFQVVLFKGVSRFARDTVDSLTMLRVLSAAKVRVISMEENFDSDKDRAEFVFTIHSALAQAESEKTSIRVRMGAFEKAKSGRWNGKVPDGYRLNPETQTLIEDSVMAPLVRSIFALYLNGYGCRSIASWLDDRGIATKAGNRWSARQIARMLQNPAYVGDLVYGRRTKALTMREGKRQRLQKRTVAVANEADLVVVHDAHPAIVDPATFAAVAAIFEARRSKYRQKYQHSSPRR